MTRDYWATPADRETARAWYEENMKISDHPGCSGNPHRVVLIDWQERERQMQEANKARAEETLMRLVKREVIYVRVIATQELKVYGSIMEVIRAFDAIPKNLERAMRCKKSTRGIIAWREGEEEPRRDVTPVGEISLEDLETGKVLTFPNVNTASIQLGVDRRYILGVVTGQRIQAGKYKLPGTVDRLTVGYFIDDGTGEKFYLRLTDYDAILGKYKGYLSKMIRYTRGDGQYPYIRIRSMKEGKIVYDSLDKTGERV